MDGATPRIETRPAGPGDEPFLFALFSSVKGASLVSAGLPEPLVATLLRSQYAGQRMSYRAQHPAAEHDVLLASGGPVGAAWVAREAERIHVVDVVIDAAQRGGGLGTAWFRARQAEARDAGVPLTLDVAIDNADARRLYERLGFVVTGATDTHIAMRWTP